MVPPFFIFTNMQNIDGQSPQEQNKSFVEKVAQLKPLADSGDKKAVYDLANTYADELALHDDDPELGKECYKYVRQAIDMGYTDFYVQLAALYGQGVGVKRQPADAVHYLQLFLDNYDTDATPPLRYFARYLLSCYKASGEGTQRDAPYAYSLIKESLAINNCEEALEVKQELEDIYPFDDEGEIDIEHHGRSKWLTFFIILGILGSIWGFVMPNTIKEAGEILGIPFYIGMACNLAIYGGLLFWQKWSGWAVLVQWFVSFIGGNAALFSMAQSGFTSLSPIAQLGFSQLANFYVGTFILALLQRRKKGYALPWCSVTGMRDDGRNMFARMKDLLMAYGEGDEYRADSSETKTFTICCQVATALIAVIGVYVGYLYITSDKSWGMDIEWKCWNSPVLWGFLSFIGFFAQFFDWQHFSYVTYNVWKDSNGRELKRERDHDMLTEMEGGILMPLLMHLIVVPAMYGAVFYYIIMGAIALLGALIPYFVAVLAVALAWPFYKVCTHFLPRQWRIVLLAIWFVCMAFFLLALSTGASHSLSSKSSSAVETTLPQSIGHATVTANVANLRTGPGIEYDYYTQSDGQKLQVTQGNEIQIIEDSGEWYKILTADKGMAFIKKTLCSEMQLYQTEPEEVDYSSDEEVPVVDSTVVAEPSDEEAGYGEAENSSTLSESTESASSEQVVTAKASAVGDEVFDVVDQMPEFVGGASSLRSYISQNVRYPAIAEENGVQGTVVVKFVVERDGTVTSVQVARSVDPSLDKEAVRVVKGMPRWIPGKKNGQPVRVSYTIPVSFRL